MKRKIEAILENKKVSIFLIAIILLNVIVFILETEHSFNLKYHHLIHYFEVFSVGIFSIEYLLRLITVRSFKEIFQPLMVVDLLAILPFYISFMQINTIILRVLRLFRLLRIFKVGRYTDAFINIKNGFASKKNELTIVGLLFLFGIIVSSSLMYFAEGSINPKDFGSIPRAFWWSVVTFTTVGYGDVCPITLLGRVIASITAIVGVGLHGLLIGVIGAAFMNVLNSPIMGEGINHSKIREESLS